ncbi:glycerophosphodiester phosphodiesterase family protein [Candidatus Latescibacterota bacterium]
MLSNHYLKYIMNNTGRKNLPVEIVAHRGASYLAPENTLSSINLAWEMYADGIEIDIHLSCDGKIILLHDNNTKRTAGADIEVRAAASSVLRSLDTGILKSVDFAGEKIPFLEEVINNIPSDGTVFVEIKCGPEIFPALEKIITQSGNISRLAIIGFNIDTISGAKERFPEIPVYWLCDVIRDERTGNPLAHDSSLVELALGRNINGLSVHSAGITRDFAETVLTSGLKLYGWTVNDIDDAKKLIALGVHGIVTDRPGWIRKHLA